MPITMREVAAAVGVSQSTVSKALRNDPTIPRERCAEIRQAAAQMGYAPNPMISALMAQLHSRRRRSDPHHLAWLDFWPATSRPLAILAPILAGARRRAAELGYDIEVYRVARSGLRSERLRQILVTRSQWGVIIPPVPQSAMHLELDMRGLAGVTIGTSLRSPPLNRVSPNHFQGAALACARLRREGFRRIGFAITAEHHERVEGKWMGAYLAAQQSWPAAERLPLLLPDSGGREQVRAWIRRERPDAVLVADREVHCWLTSINSTLRPRVAWLVFDEAPPGAWGVDYRAHQIGVSAVDLLLAQLHLNQRGSPVAPSTVMIDSAWRGA